MTMNVLEQYLFDAERAFEQQDYWRGKELLEEALVEEPTYGKAHNHMGWLYLFHMIDYEKAESHLRLALKYAPGYNAPYQHMSTLLYEAKRLDEHESMLHKAKEIMGVSHSFIYNDLGRNSEVRGRYSKALKCYREAIKWSMDTHEITVLKENIRRCREKLWRSLFVIW